MEICSKKKTTFHFILPKLSKNVVWEGMRPRKEQKMGTFIQEQITCETMGEGAALCIHQV